MVKVANKKKVQKILNKLLVPAAALYKSAGKVVKKTKEAMPVVYNELESNIKSHLITFERRNFKDTNIDELSNLITSNLVRRLPSLSEEELNKIMDDKSSKSFLDMVVLGLGTTVGKDYTKIKKEKLFKSILIANRGEIALRIIRACKELDIKAHVIYSKPEKNSLIVRFADKVYNIGDPKNYLNIKKIIDIAKKANVDAIHPGYGYLSENSEFSRLCSKQGIVFIGPSAKSMELMGNKVKAREIMHKIKVPVLEGTTKPFEDISKAKEIAVKIGYPVILKAVAGGGGKGMRIVRKEKEFENLFKSAENEAMAAFGNKDLYMEKYLEDPKHIEFQILADKYGNAIHLGERDCSIQRRHQKLIEEAPSISLSKAMRDKLGSIAVKITKAINYKGAGTVEFLVDKKNNFYFMEMNTRIQVEHGVTEMITSVDLVKEQIKIASGAKLANSQDDIILRGHAIECRINAEDPCNDFKPSTGYISNYLPPGGQGIRVSSHTHQGHTISHHYDPLISNLICWGETRDACRMRMARALSEYIIEGVETNIPFHKEVMKNKEFIKGKMSTNFIEKNELLKKIQTKVCKPTLTPKKKELIVTAAVAKYMETRPKHENSKVSAWVMTGRQENLDKNFNS